MSVKISPLYCAIFGIHGFFDMHKHSTPSLHVRFDIFSILSFKISIVFTLSKFFLVTASAEIFDEILIPGAAQESDDWLELAFASNVVNAIARRAHEAKQFLIIIA